MWRACRESIPTKANLRRRHITDNPLCERCLMKEETTLHALWSYNKLSSAWTSLEPHKLQGALILDTQQPWQSGAFCDDDVGHMSLAELGSTSQTVLPIGPDHSPSEGEARRIQCHNSTSTTNDATNKNEVEAT